MADEYDAAEEMDALGMAGTSGRVPRERDAYDMIVDERDKLREELVETRKLLARSLQWVGTEDMNERELAWWKAHGRDLIESEGES